MTCEQWGLLTGAQWASRSLRVGRQGRPGSIDLDRLSQGDRDEWRLLIQREYDRLVIHAATIVHNAHDAMDVAQNVFVRLWLARESLRKVRDIAAYTKATTRNQALNHLRARRGHDKVVLLGAEVDSLPCRAASSPRQRAAARECAEMLDRASQHLTPCQRRMFDEISLDPSASCREIARRLGCSHTNALALPPIRRPRRSSPGFEITDYIPRYSEEELCSIADQRLDIAQAYLDRTGRVGPGWRLREMFEIDSIVNRSDAKQMLSVSLFCKPPWPNIYEPPHCSRKPGTCLVDNESCPQIPLEQLHDECEFTRVCRRPAKMRRLKAPTFYSMYVKRLLYPRPDGLGLRVYLAYDLQRLIPLLVSHDIEVRVMKSSSLSTSPGSMWRHLAFSDRSLECVAAIDSDTLRIAPLEPDILPRLSGLGRRLPRTHRWARGFLYNPLLAGGIFVRPAFGPHDMRKCLLGYIIARLLADVSPNSPVGSAPGMPPRRARGGIGGACTPRGGWQPSRPSTSGRLRRTFPGYGFDEAFLSEFLYYWFGERGLVATRVREYATQDHLQRCDIAFLRRHRGNIFHES